MKKFTAILLTALMILALVSCGTAPEKKTGEEAAPTAGTAAGEETDSAYVIGKGTLVVGITDFKPMDYQDENGKWIGFDADLAAAFAKDLGVDVEFVEIDWDNKIMELNGKSIDCVWNGMTLTDEVKAAMETSNAYINNAQIIVVKKDVADQYKTAADCKDLQFAVENGSAGKDAAEDNGFTFTEVQYQSDALMEVAAGTSDAAIIDSLMAGAMVGEGTGYADLTTTAKLTTEEYGVGFRKGSDLAAKLNDFFAANTAMIKELAETYGVQEALID
ncbi:MAG: transporter substrate-binding domain-containing protein [Clostridia bacterium]|nr:transporter substrate-binding domain-containing protein [Clostridia bacterium]